MAYTLTLTRSERRAFDWIGNRYSNGDDMRAILIQCYATEIDWHDGEEDITFTITEPDAWALADLLAWELADPAYIDAVDGAAPWTCFAPELAGKMQKFVDGII